MRINLFLFLAITAILFTSPIIFGNAFAADKPTKLQKECAKEKDPSKIKPDCELLNLINENNSHPQSNSFFDVFTELGFTVDSFFDIFTELQRAIGDPDFDLLRNGISDFDTEVATRMTADNTLQSNINAEATARQAADAQLQSNIDNEAAARATADALLQTRVNGNCAVGSSIRQIHSDGSVSCEPDDVGTGLIGRLQVIERVDLTPGNLPGGGATTFSFAPCLPGEIVVGGGYRTSPATVNVFGESSAFSEGSFGWFVNAYYESGTAPGSITAIAYCASIIP